MKYIMLLSVEPVPMEFPVIFPDELVHADIFKAIRGMKVRLADTNRWARPYADLKAVSAGTILLGSVRCSGSSETLKLHSREQDASIIYAHDYLRGII